MIINHPFLGPRDASEFVCLGDASLINRPEWKGKDANEESAHNAIDRFHSYQYLRSNNAGEHKELWYHEQGDRSWLIVTRDTITHEVYKVELARDVKRTGQPGSTHL